MGEVDSSCPDQNEHLDCENKSSSRRHRHWVVDEDEQIARMSGNDAVAEKDDPTFDCGLGNWRPDIDLAKGLGVADGRGWLDVPLDFLEKTDPILTLDERKQAVHDARAALLTWEFELGDRVKVTNSLAPGSWTVGEVVDNRTALQVRVVGSEVLI